MSNIPKYSNPYEFDMLLQEPVHEMMKTGILIDQNIKSALQKESLEKWHEAQETLNKFVGVKVNVGSPKQIMTLLYDGLGLPKKTKRVKKEDDDGIVTEENKATSDEDSIRALMAECKAKVNSLKTDSARLKWESGYVICHYILKIRGIRKEISSYLGVSIQKGKPAGFSRLEDPDGRIRGSISVGGTETHRFSHSKTLWDSGVNLATVPKHLRKMYVAEDGQELAEFDLNRGESWVYAHLSEDPELMRIHNGGLDFHSETASAISLPFGKPLTVDYIVEHKNDECFMIRYVGKKVNHATSYRMKKRVCAESINAEAEETGITLTESQAAVAQEAWHRKYFMVRGNWWPEIERQLVKDRTMVTPYGRKHMFHGYRNTNRAYANDEVFKAATAYVPQSTSVDYLNRGFFRVYYELQKKGLLKVLNQVHDSLLISYRIGDRDEVIPLVKSLMTSTLRIKKYEFSIPVEPQYGHSWGTVKAYHGPGV